MIKFIKKYLERKAKEKQDRIDRELTRVSIKRERLITELKALRLITINNAMYIRSSINVLNSAVNHAKGSNAAETKKKREFLRNRLDWLKLKQVEEEDMILYYDSILSKA